MPLEDFDVVGRIDAAARSPEVWTYRNRETGGELFVDVGGHPYWLRPDGRRRAGYRFAPLSLVAAAAAVGVFHGSSRLGWDDDIEPVPAPSEHRPLRVLVTPSS